MVNTDGLAPGESTSPGAAQPTATRAIAVQYQSKTKPFRRYITGYALAALGINLLWGAVAAILIPLQVQGLEFARIFTGADAGVDLQALTTLQAQVAAGTATATEDQTRLLGLLSDFNSSRAAGLSLVTSVGVAITMIIQPIIGILSDRTRSRWGRRSPFIFGGAVAGGAVIALMPIAPTVGALMVAWTLVQIVINFAQGPLIATVADRVPEQSIGGISALSGLISYGASIVGSIVAGSMFAALGLAAYYPFAILVAVLPVLFVVLAKDKPSRDLTPTRMTFGGFFASYISGLRDRDFRWAWVSKVILYIGYGIATVYGVYMLQAYISPALSVNEAAQVAPLLQFAALPGTLIAMGIAGKLSDKVGRRKPFVASAAIIMAFSFLVPFFWPSLPGMFIQAIVAGIGFGTFIVVDQALFIEVLPDKEAAARDLGMSTLGQNLGQALAPVIAGAVVAIFAGQYGPVWPVGFFLVLLAGLAIIPIRRVR